MEPSDLSLCLIDFRLAFDSIVRDSMYEILKQYGLLVKIVNIIRNSYDGFKCRVKSEGEVGDTFEVRAGVRQGDVWSLFLFEVVRGGTDIGQIVADLDFADDVALVRSSDQEHQKTKSFVF